MIDWLTLFSGLLYIVLAYGFILVKDRILRHDTHYCIGAIHYGADEILVWVPKADSDYEVWKDPESLRRFVKSGNLD